MSCPVWGFRNVKPFGFGVLLQNLCSQFHYYMRSFS